MSRPQAAALFAATLLVCCVPERGGQDTGLSAAGGSGGTTGSADGASSGGVAQDGSASDSAASLPPLGGPCGAAADCQSGICTSGRCSRACSVPTDCPPGPEWSCAFVPGSGGQCACAPTGAEVCDGRDNDCNGIIDDATCPGAMACQDGTCVCPPSRQCRTECVDTSSDLAHCGACDVVCPLGSVCASGVCVCPGQGSLCNGACTNLSGDRAHCGSCGTSCALGEDCVSGKCTCTHVLCGATCVLVDTDPKNCGACGHDCFGGSCLESMCQPITLIADSAPSSLLLFQNQLYWLTGAGTIERASTDGSGLMTLTTAGNFGGLTRPAIAANASGFFWANGAFVYGIPLDGSAPPTLVVNEYDINYGEKLAGMTIDDSHVYWTTWDGFVKKGNLDGTGVTVLVSNQDAPVSPVVNATKLYWIDTGPLMNGGNGTIMSANLDGSSPVAIRSGSDIGYRLQLLPSKLFWSQGGNLVFSDLDGNNASAFAPGGLERLSGDTNAVYWLGAVAYTRGIYRSPYTGGSSTLLIGAQIIDCDADARFVYYTWNDYSSLSKRGVMRLAK